MKKIIIIALLLFLAACTDATKTREVLTAQGYTNIEITGYELFGCSSSDTYHTGFKAVGIGGKEVRGVVCQGLWFKAATVRIK